jgi:hypothetical protein
MKNMKKISMFSAAILLLAALCAVAAETEVFEIRERMFIQQCYDIMFNPDEYLGKTVRLEGIYRTFRFPVGGVEETTHYVYRNSPGCCGNDGMTGFMVFPEDCSIPEQYAWVEATGKVEVTDRNMVALRLSGLKVMDKRGTEFVRN